MDNLTQGHSISIIKQSAPATARFEGPRFIAGANLSGTAVVPASFWDTLKTVGMGALKGAMGSLH